MLVSECIVTANTAAGTVGPWWVMLAGALWKLCCSLVQSHGWAHPISHCTGSREWVGKLVCYQYNASYPCCNILGCPWYVDGVKSYSDIYTKIWSNAITSYSPQTLECYTCWSLWHKSLTSLGATRVNNYQRVQQPSSPLSLPTLQVMRLLPHKSPSTIILWYGIFSSFFYVVIY